MARGERVSTPGSFGTMCLRSLKENVLLILILFSVIGGCVLGFALRGVDPPLTKREVMYLGFLGKIFLRMLKLLILPLIVSSLIAGLAGLDSKASGRMGWVAILYYLTTTLLAVILGIVLVYIIHPGEGNPHDIEKQHGGRNVTIADTFLDLIRNMFPDNIVEACFKKPYTVLVPPMQETINITNSSTGIVSEELAPLPDLLEWDFKVVTGNGMNMLGIVVFSVALGCIIARMGPEGEPLKQFFISLSHASMQLVYIVMWFSPVGILFLCAAKIVEMNDLSSLGSQMGMYTLTVLIGLAIHGFIVLPILLFVFTRRNPFKYIYGVSQALLTAIGTASSSATLPITISCLENNLHVDGRVARFVLPVGATINMDGTALYEAVAVLFIAQVQQVPLSFGQVIAVSITATAASIGAAGVPQAGLVTMAMVLTAVGLPLDNISLILAVDWFLDRFRTAINVLGDSVGSGIVEHFAKSTLPPLDSEMNPFNDGDSSIRGSGRRGSGRRDSRRSSGFDKRNGKVNMPFGGGGGGGDMQQQQQLVKEDGMLMPRPPTSNNGYTATEEEEQLVVEMPLIANRNPRPDIKSAGMLQHSVSCDVNF